jgi:hypothetical protein
MNEEALCKVRRKYTIPCGNGGVVLSLVLILGII